MHKTCTSHTLVLSLFFTCSELNTLLKPDKQRANELKREFEKGFVGIARRIWPNLTHAHGVVTGKERFSSAVTNILLFCLWYFRPRYFKHWWIVQFRVSYVEFELALLKLSLGSSELYATQLRRRYLKGVPLCSTIYGATEGLIGVNLWPLENTPYYLLVPRSMFFEFIPMEYSQEEQPKVWKIVLSRPDSETAVSCNNILIFL